MFEGTELEGKIGEYGSYSFDIDDKLDINGNVTLKIDLVAELRKATVNSNNPIVTRIIAMVAKFTGKDVMSAEAPTPTDRTGAPIAGPSADTDYTPNKSTEPDSGDRQ